jgi:hypothetical protein
VSTARVTSLAGVAVLNCKGKGMNNPYSSSSSELALEPDVEIGEVPMLNAYVIYAAIIGGLLFYAGFVILNSDQTKLAFDWTVVKWNEDWLFLVMMIAASFIVPAFAHKWIIAKAFNPAKQGIFTDREIFGQYLTQFIIGLALLEMCAFLFIFRFSNSSNLAFFALAAIAIFMIVVRFPSRSKLIAWWKRNQPAEMH